MFLNERNASLEIIKKSRGEQGSRNRSKGEEKIRDKSCQIFISR